MPRSPSLVSTLMPLLGPERELCQRLNSKRSGVVRTFTTISSVGGDTPTPQHAARRHIAVGVHSIQNTRKQMEDTYCHKTSEAGECLYIPRKCTSSSLNEGE